MANTNTYTGFNASTSKRLMLDAGAVFKNFDVATDTYATAKAAGKLIGATQGGNSFAAIPTIRQIAIDGVKGAAKGLEVIDAWEVTLTTNILEVSKDTIELALATSRATGDTFNDFYDKIQAENYILDADYLTNVTFMGKISGTSEPVIIQVKNAMNTTGLTLSAADNAEGVIVMTFRGHYDTADLNTPPFVVYFPKAEGGISGTVTDTGTPVEGATVTVTIETTNFTTTTDSSGAYTLTGIPYGDVTVTATKGAKTGTDTGTVVAGTTTALGAIAIA
jgi:hypothetical protein